MKYGVAIVLAVLVTAAGYWLFVSGNPFDRGQPAAKADGQLAEVNQKIADLTARLDALAFDSEREFGRLNGKISELEPQADNTEPENGQEAKSLSEDVLELRTQLDSARFRLSQLEEEVENYHALSLSLQEKLIESQTRLEAVQEELSRIKAQNPSPEENSEGPAGTKNGSKSKNGEEKPPGDHP